jgi:hypothetical protein
MFWLLHVATYLPVRQARGSSSEIKFSYQFMKPIRLRTTVGWNNFIFYKYGFIINKHGFKKVAIFWNTQSNEVLVNCYATVYFHLYTFFALREWAEYILVHQTCTFHFPHHSVASEKISCERRTLIVFN